MITVLDSQMSSLGAIHFNTQNNKPHAKIETPTKVMIQLNPPTKTKTNLQNKNSNNYIFNMLVISNSIFSLDKPFPGLNVSLPTRNAPIRIHYN